MKPGPGCQPSGCAAQRCQLPQALSAGPALPTEEMPGLLASVNQPAEAGTATSAKCAEVALPPARSPASQAVPCELAELCFAAGWDGRDFTFAHIVLLHPSFQDCPPPYFSSSQRLVGPQCGTSRLESAAENPGVQGDELFCVGPPSSYQLPSWEQPRLPSYESVRKKDRQREIHQMIAERFGLWAEPSQEMPPPYEHALRHPPAFSGTVMSSETLDRRGVSDPFQAPLSYQTQRNTAV
ncbi:uncharacterized protein LOC121082422 isoform X1 [Falco naumanni]|uniref:uncharacterized protein LOC121082422 isoform X1 n=1 Tax=Falco naumanni TaxID=148594 RepID=UPI001ADE4C41|nr:uncharacterized protein LOC121082422 isoform X1 [Falco naumanni]